MKRTNKFKIRLHNFIRPLSVIAIATLSLLAGGLLISRANAEEIQTWGPQDRPTFTWKEPADYVTFNSITDNPSIGDERNFVRIRKADTSDVADDNIDLEVGQQYEVVVWFHNNAKSRLNTEAGNPGIANNARLLIGMPKILEGGNTAEIKGTISATNSNPTEVWDNAYAYTDSTVALHYVANSAEIHLYTPGTYDAAKGAYFDAQGYETVEGKILNSEALFGLDGGRGANLAFWADSWGSVPGCSEYSGYVTYKFVVDQPDFSFAKTVSKDGENNFNETVSARPGDVLEFKLKYHNTGTMIQDNIIVTDTLPEGLTYIEDSTYFVSSRHEEGKSVPADQFGNGLNLGDFEPGDSMYVTYKARVEDDQKLFPCGDSVVYNNGTLYTQNGTAYDKAEIDVSRVCDCATNPEMEGCQELPSTGPVEIVIATLIIGGIGGTGYYFYATRRNLKAVQSNVMGGTPKSAHSASELHGKHSGRHDKE